MGARVASRTRRFWAYIVDQLLLTIGGVIVFVAVFATQTTQITNLTNLVVSSPLWSEQGQMSRGESDEKLMELFSSEPVTSALQSLAYPFALTVTVILVLQAAYYIVPTTKWGVTFGKKIAHIRVASTATGLKPSMEQSAIRYFTYLGAGTFGSIVTILDLIVNKSFLPSNVAVDILSGILSQAVYILSVVVIVMIIVRADRRGLHDILAKTIVYTNPVPEKKK